ncbi:MAG TPA: polymer-forming cytoskeletal protein [Steroidobacteraceae bacterium]|nr:polymer-forming cytoskeletal protein [Steroidobacteraceae bacterium]
MFRRKNDMAIDASRLAGLLAADTCVRGDVTFAGGMRIDGRVEGNVTGKPDGRDLLVLSEKGVIVGSVKVHDAVINGRVEGDMEVGHFLELQPGAHVTGNITYRTLKLECGATVDGKLARSGEDSAAAGADAGSKVVSFAKAP